MWAGLWDRHAARNGNPYQCVTCRECVADDVSAIHTSNFTTPIAYLHERIITAKPDGDVQPSYSRSAEVTPELQSKVRHAIR
jgi:succinate dehydrogenase/fumarate reductase-like Fe-S protein